MQKEGLHITPVKLLADCLPAGVPGACRRVDINEETLRSVGIWKLNYWNFKSTRYLVT